MPVRALPLLPLVRGDLFPLPFLTATHTSFLTFVPVVSNVHEDSAPLGHEADGAAIYVAAHPEYGIIPRGGGATHAQA